MRDVFAGGLAGFEDADGQIDYETVEEDVEETVEAEPDDGFDREAFAEALEKTAEPAPAPAPAPEPAAPRPAVKPAAAAPKAQAPVPDVTKLGKDPVAEVLSDIGGYVTGWMAERDAAQKVEVDALEAKVADRDGRIGELAAELSTTRAELAACRSDLSVAQDRLRCLRTLLYVEDASVGDVLRTLERFSGDRR